MTNYFAAFIKKLKRNRVRVRNTFFGLILLALIVLLFIFIGFYISAFSGDLLPGKRDELGQLGDYFGGLLNPIFGFASFLALLATIFYQSKELKLSRNELELTREELSNSATALSAQNKAIELQSFEQTFFSWLNTYHELLKSIEHTETMRPLYGRQALYKIHSSNLSAYSIYNSMLDPEMDCFLLEQFKTPSTDDGQFNEQSFYVKVKIISEFHKEKISNHLHAIWVIVYQNNEYQLDSLFRTIYKIIYWIDSLPENKLTKEQKWLYISILRSQLSWIEIVFIYYNGLTGIGEKFKTLIEKYALFDNLTFDSDIGLKVMHTYFDRNGYYKPTAFDSNRAKNLL
jgi:Putative phage abortive infection protein